jgi:prolipoprotein diacylglyceryltransferase
MLPTVFTIPLPWGGGIPIKGYGLMMMIGFLTAIWMCMRRAQKVRTDPDVVLNAGFLALLCGVFGARIFYVVHYWDTQFKGRGLSAAFDVTSGGLEFYGGFICAVVAIMIYLRIKGHSMRLFLDIMAPGVMWGLAFGRLGCTLNGCCFGGTCPAHVPWPLAVTFPYASPGHVHHFQTNRVTLPRELMYIDSFGLVRPIARDHIAMKPEEIYKPKTDYKQASDALETAFAQLSPPETAERIRTVWRRYAVERRLLPRGFLAKLDTQRNRQSQARVDSIWQELANACSAAPNGQQLIELVRAEHKAWNAWQEHATQLRDLLGDNLNPRPEPANIQVLQDLASRFRSHRVYAAQPLGFINAMILSGILSLFFYRRQVHGATFGLMFILYPITRLILEWIRADNPLDSGGLTISQAISVGILPIALVYMFFIYRFLPPQSPRARIWKPPPKDPPPPTDGASRPADRPDVANPSADATANEANTQKDKIKSRAKQRKPVVETVVVAPGTAGAPEQEWSQSEAVCAKCGQMLKPPDGLIYQQRAAKRSAQSRAAGVPEIESPDPNTNMELICEACFDRRPPQDKARAKRLAKKWWKTGKV